MYLPTVLLVTALTLIPQTSAIPLPTALGRFHAAPSVDWIDGTDLSKRTPLMALVAAARYKEKHDAGDHPKRANGDGGNRGPPPDWDDERRDSEVSKRTPLFALVAAERYKAEEDASDHSKRANGNGGNRDSRLDWDDKK